MKILQFPLAKISIGFILGILLFPLFKINPKSSLEIFSFLVILLLISFFIKSKSKIYVVLFGILLFITAVFAGLTNVSLHKQTNYPEHYLNQISDFDAKINFNLLIYERLKNTKTNARYIAKVKTLSNKKSSGKIILNVLLKDSSFSLITGSKITITSSLFKNKPPFNPNQFDYSKYLENKEIYGQIYCDSKEIKVIDFEKSTWSFFSNYREKLIQTLEKSNFSKKELSVFSALLLGQKQEISPDILKDYQYAGAVHILSVSGLHVGFIMLFITFLLKPISNSRKGSLFKLLITIISLWIFAILVGLSPSVVRSVTMFSFLAIGLNLKKTTNIFHTLLVSMFLILFVNPSFIHDVGFQLSYSALFFILWLQPIFKKIWLPKNKIANYFWDILTVSFAAQIGTMPLTIYYFHQFPGLFFITNLIVLPLLGLIMIIGIITLLFAATGFVPKVICLITSYSISLLNSLVHWVASFESFILKNIPFSFEMLLTFYFFIIMIFIWINKPTFSRLSLTITSILLLQIVFIKQKKNTLYCEEGIIFNLKRNTLITERSGNNISAFANDSILEKSNVNLALQSYLTGNFCQLKEKKILKNLMIINSKKIVIIDSSSVYLQNVNPDILIITQSAKVNLERLLKTVKPKVVIVDGSNFKSYCKLWEATCRKEKILFHNTYEKGFYKF